MLQPLKRAAPRAEGRFEPVSWDAALADIATRLKAIAARDPQAILPYSYAGTMGLVQGEGMAARFFNRLGAVAAGPHHLRQRRRRGAGRHLRRQAGHACEHFAAAAG